MREEGIEFLIEFFGVLSFRTLADGVQLPGRLAEQGFAHPRRQRAEKVRKLTAQVDIGGPTSQPREAARLHAPDGLPRNAAKIIEVPLACAEARQTRPQPLGLSEVAE